MPPWMFTINHFLAQMMPGDFDDKPAAPAAPVQHPMSFSDWQRGLRTASHTDPSDRRFEIAMCAMIAAVILVGILLQLRQRRKEALPPNSTRRLAWELLRKIRFPIHARLFLAWVSHNARIPMAHLMISDNAFDRALSAWANQPTFALLRRWGHARLQKCRPLLFDE